ncbi:LysR family transcriptional regulator [Streptomyces roseirectus]|uniref:LysR family transcriptional regulator n=1 Tax=Streptomyces roseirectus TaxID=2768066 RepID=A0A7H0IE94_9ACTN|nr:LysR family transcriptional regulator [Streptomyces roseirectus]QNP71110.1 LysR family transcriptional regulator [Streptomyces roseirectus]
MFDQRSAAPANGVPRPGPPDPDGRPPGRPRHRHAATDHVGFSLAQLRYFVVAAEMGNISEAAELLCASQSTVSSAVMRLERRLGVQLLLRHRSRGVTLTPSGRRLLREARALLRQAENIQAQGDALVNDTAGRLDVGFFLPVTPFLLPLAYRLTKERHARLQLNVHEESAELLLDRLRDGLCELIVTYDFLAAESAFHPLAELPLHALLPGDDPRGTDGAPLPLAELSTRPLITLDSAPLVRHFEKLYANAGAPAPRVITASTPETVRGLVAAGAGISLTYERSSTPTTLDGNTLHTLPITAPTPPTTALGIATPPGLTMTTRATAFRDILHTAIPTAYGTASHATG